MLARIFAQINGRIFSPDDVGGFVLNEIAMPQSILWRQFMQRAFPGKDGFWIRKHLAISGAQAPDGPVPKASCKAWSETPTWYELFRRAGNCL
jgi:hypothetical protein